MDNNECRYTNLKIGLFTPLYSMKKTLKDATIKVAM